jgi:hypothetical protein
MSAHRLPIAFPQSAHHLPIVCRFFLRHFANFSHRLPIACPSLAHRLPAIPARAKKTDYPLPKGVWL